MEYKTPTLEEVKEYFKNAKEVIGVCDTKAHFDLSDERGIHKWSDDFWIYAENGNCILFDSNNNKYAQIISYKEEIKTPTHYDNSKGSIYQFCENQNLNSSEFDIIKRVVRSRKKGNFKEDLEKTKHLIDLYLSEYDN